MITKMAESPTSTCSPPTSSFQLPQSTSLQFCSSPRGSVTTEPRRREGSPKSPTQESLSQKRARNRQTPYQNNKSPSGSCCSSSDESNENDVEILTGAESKAKRIQANSRERKRMHTVNSAFDQLRELVPTYPSNRKLSKIDTLRLACTYIQDLVSVLHQTRTMQGLQGEDLTQFPVYGDSYLNGPYSSCFSVKTEATMTEFPAAFTNYRMPSTCLTPNCDSDYSTSETETHSPPFLPPTSHSTLPGIGVRPPPLSRTSSDSVAHIHRQMAHATVSVNGSQMHSQTAQRQMTIPSPLATHSVHHSTPPLVSSEFGIHQSPPVWQRSGSMPAYPAAVYGQ